MNVLAIGNSFSEDATRYLHEIAKADGEMINIINLYIGGCSLERHYRNMLSDQKAYELQYNGHKTGFLVSLSEALLNRRWDVITLQQASHFSFDMNSYLPYITVLVDFIKKYSPKAKIFIHQTWAYENNSERLLNVAKYESAEKMLADIVKAYKEVSELIRADGLIPSGELFGNLLSNGITEIHRDTFHATRGIGRYALALLWYKTLSGRSVLENTFFDFDEPISEDIVKVIKETVESTLSI